MSAYNSYSAIRLTTSFDTAIECLDLFYNQRSRWTWKQEETFLALYKATLKRAQIAIVGTYEEPDKLLVYRPNVRTHISPELCALAIRLQASRDSCTPLSELVPDPIYVGSLDASNCSDLLTADVIKVLFGDRSA